MQHLDEGTIHAWIDSALDAAEARRVEAHLAECPSCASAVAEARGLVAASSRILSGLDIVPADVIPATPTAAQADATAAPQAGGVPASTAPRGDGSMHGRQSRWLPRTARIAAVVAIAAVGATMATRITSDRAARSVGPATGARRGAPNTPVRAKHAPEVADAGRTLDQQSDSPREPAKGATQARRRDVASAKPVAPAPTASASGVGRASADSIARPQASQSQARVSAAPVDVRRPDAQLRLVSTEWVPTPDARVVIRRVYEVRPGVRVTLEETALPANQVIRAYEGERARPNVPTAPPAPEALSQLGASPDSAGDNSIRWTDSTGKHFTLTGRLSTEELRRLKELVR